MIKFWMTFGGAHGFLIFLCVGAVMVYACVAASLLCARRKRQRRSRQMLGREVHDATVRELERMGID